MYVDSLLCLQVLRAIPLAEAACKFLECQRSKETNKTHKMFRLNAFV